MIAVAENGSITEASKILFISQPSLSEAVHQVENETCVTVFTRSRAGVALTKEGMEFLGYARQVVQQMELLEAKYINNEPPQTEVLHFHPALYLYHKCFRGADSEVWRGTVRIYPE